MNRLLHATAVVLLFGAALIISGCVQRTIRVHSDPPGALVWLNDEEVGRTPVEVPFLFYGTYSVRLEKEGYQTLQTTGEASPPWWDLPGVDLVAEAVPADLEADIRWNYQLQPEQETDPQRLLDHARQLRATFRQGAGEQPATGDDDSPPAGRD